MEPMGRLKFKYIATIITMVAILSLPWTKALPMPTGRGVLLTDDGGKTIYAENPDMPLVPASTLKLITSLAAIEYLGKNFKFQTQVQYLPHNKNLYIKGFGDPLFTSEAIARMARTIIQKGHLNRVKDIILDSYFNTKNIRIPGTGHSLNPYDSTTGALCANFNTLSFQWDKDRQKFISSEPQTPLLFNIFQNEIEASKIKKGRILLSPHLQIKYPGYLLQFFLRKHGVTCEGDIKIGKLKAPAGMTWEIESPYSLREILSKLLYYSNNFIANQLILTMGARQTHPPATLEKSQRLLNQFAQKKLGLKNVKIFEGSGLSRKNRISPTQMGKVLIAFLPHYKLLRMGDGEFYKTGTLSKVRTRAGFICGKNKKLYPFVVMLNQQPKGYKKIMKALKQKVRLHETLY